jgi:hypothetical protein
MQLRVARLCLDCEEIHAEDRCPRCVSEHYAFMTTWLPVEERRRWPSARPNPAVAQPRGLAAFAQAIASWLRGGPSAARQPISRATRRSDHVAGLDFDRRRDPASSDHHPVRDERVARPAR